MKSLHQHINPECLPSNYGGKYDIPEETGAALGDLFRLYTKEFESMYHFISSLILNQIC